MREEFDIPMPSMTPGGASATNFRVPRQPEGLDSNTRRMAIVAAAIVGLFAVFAGAYSFMGHRRAGVPVVEADPKPLREKPKDAGGMQVVGKDEGIMSGQSDAKAAISPPAEAPAPQALRTATAAPPTAASAPVASNVVTPVKPAVTAAPAASAPGKTAQIDPKTVAKPAAQAAAAPAPGAITATPAPAMPGKGAQVQLAAVGSEQAALAEWQRLAKKMPDLFGGKAPAISKIERDGKTMWRVRTGGFADPNAAKAFCEHVKAKAAGCLVAAS